MRFLIYAEDIEDSEELRAPLRAAHIARREALFREQRLLVSGPLSEQPGKPYTGSLLLADFDSLEDAQAWAATDPYSVAGIYRRIVVRHFNQHFPRPPEAPTLMRKYMLVLRGNADAFAALPPEEQGRAVQSHKSWAGALAQRGALLGGDGFLADTVLLSPGPDGPHAERGAYKGRDDALSGYYLVQCASLDDAVSLARECPALSQGESVEVVPLGH